MSEKTVREILKASFSKLLNAKRLGFWLSLGYFIIMLFCTLLFHKIGDYGVETDFYWSYVPEAKSISKGQLIIDAFRGPFYPLTLYFIEKIFHDYFISGLIIGILSASISIWFIFKLFEAMFNRTIALLSIFFIIFNPIFVQFTYSNGTDMLFFFLSYALLYFFHKEKPTKSIILFIALLTSAVYLTRYNGVFLLFAIPIIIVILDIWAFEYKKRILYSVIYIFLFLLCIAPWNIYTYKTLGEFFYNHNYKNIAYEFFAKGKMGWDIFWFSYSSKFQSLYDVISYNPLYFLSHSLFNFINYLFKNLKDLVGWHIGVTFIFGIIFFLFNSTKNVKQKSYFIFCFIFLAILSLTFYSDRFSLFLVPFYTVFSIKFLLEINKSKKYSFSPFYGYSLLVVFFYISLVWTISYNSRKINSGPNEILTISNWYKSRNLNEVSEPIIAARKPHIAYYLNMKFVLLPFADSFEDFHKKLEQQKVNYLYLNVSELGTRSDLHYLIDTSKVFNGLSLIYYSKDPNQILYKVE
jgi:hypothetical protein